MPLDFDISPLYYRHGSYDASIWVQFSEIVSVTYEATQACSIQSTDRLHGLVTDVLSKAYFINRFVIILLGYFIFVFSERGLFLQAYS